MTELTEWQQWLIDQVFSNPVVREKVLEDFKLAEAKREFFEWLSSGAQANCFPYWEHDVQLLLTLDDWEREWRDDHEQF